MTPWDDLTDHIIVAYGQLVGLVREPDEPMGNFIERLMHFLNIASGLPFLQELRVSIGKDHHCADWEYSLILESGQTFTAFYTGLN